MPGPLKVESRFCGQVEFSNPDPVANWQGPPAHGSLAIRKPMPSWNVTVTLFTFVEISLSVKAGPSKISCNASLGAVEAGQLTPLALLPVPIVQVKVNTLQPAEPLGNISPSCTRQAEVANDVPVTHVGWNSAGSIAESLTDGVTPLGLIESVPAVCAAERSYWKLIPA